MSGRLVGKVALVTGTGAGTGRAIARMFVAEGARVAGCALDPDGAAATVELVRQAGGEMRSTARLDVADHEQAARWVAEAREAFGGIDIVVNNAARVRWGHVRDTTPEDFAWVLRNEIDLEAGFMTGHELVIDGGDTTTR